MALREDHRYDQASLNAVCQFKLAAVPADDCVGDCEAQAKSPGFAVAGRLEPDERLKRPQPVLGRNSRTVIGNGDPHMVSRVFDPSLEP